MCPQYGRWFKSSFSANSSTCVEVAFVEGVGGTEARLRNSRQPDGPALAFSRAEWEAFELGVFSGRVHYARVVCPCKGLCSER